MRHQPDRLSPEDRRRRVADLFARRLNELAVRGLIDDVEVQPRPAHATEPARLEEVSDGPR
ncbi:MAG TPA: hypothetical protein DEF51_46925 [Myxococcales bacterium]|nr:hypothetical protein [Myxococcales bacterium]